ncbi:MAG TPA: DUF1365 domain-containing protein [Burkholderiaceae bacterium]|nr:DUF1365 domain-containing protein [Burkholderiaceae bacterium]
MQAAIAFGSVRHRRLRPAAHAFAYPAFFVRLPLRALAAARWPWRLLARNARGAFAINDVDHGDGRPLLAWIETLLARAGVEDARGEIWLHTFARQLGYLFNPVSFWLCERADGALRAVVAEVNNTFGDRHCYVLAHADGRPLAWGEELTAAKVMHVSPFNRVEGRYRFRFLLAPRADGARFVARIDYDDAAGPLLQTSIEGRLRPLTDAALAAALLRRPLFTLGVSARIHWQALRLWAKRVPFFARPEPTNLLR